MEERLCEVKCYESPSIGSPAMESLSVELWGRGTPPHCLAAVVSLMFSVQTFLLCTTARVQFGGGGLSLQGSPECSSRREEKVICSRKASALTGPSHVCPAGDCHTPGWRGMESFETGVGEESASSSSQRQENSAYHLGCLRNQAQVPSTIDRELNFAKGYNQVWKVWCILGPPVLGGTAHPSPTLLTLDVLVGSLSITGLPNPRP